MKKIVAMVLGALILSGCSPDDGGELFTVAETTRSGGNCQYGPCEVKVELLSDGRVVKEEGSGDESFGGASSEAVKELEDAIKEAQLEHLKPRPADYVCPDSYDGQKATYSFYPGDLQGLDSCALSTEEFLPVRLFEEIILNAF